MATLTVCTKRAQPVFDDGASEAEIAMDMQLAYLPCLVL
jgi:hypothetical protein